MKNHDPEDSKERYLEFMEQCYNVAYIIHKQNDSNVFYRVCRVVNRQREEIKEYGQYGKETSNYESKYW